jgi:hypothetical protein
VTSPASLTVAAQRAGAATLKFDAYFFADAARNATSRMGRVRVWVNGAPSAVVNAYDDTPVVFDVLLRAGDNDVQIENERGNFVPARNGGGDTRSLGIELANLEVITRER